MIWFLAIPYTVKGEGRGSPPLPACGRQGGGGHCRIYTGVAGGG